MIIVEGPDGGGKTTLISSLVQEFPTLRLMPKAVNEHGERTTDIDKYIERHYGLGFGPRLYDRFATVSGPIYGAIKYMSGPNVHFKDHVQHFQWEAVLQSIRPLIIYCLPGVETVRANLGRDPESARVVGDHLETLYYFYQTRAAIDFAHGIGVFYNYNNETDYRMLCARIRLAFAKRGEAV